MCVLRNICINTFNSVQKSTHSHRLRVKHYSNRRPGPSTVYGPTLYSTWSFLLSWFHRRPFRRKTAKHSHWPWPCVYYYYLYEWTMQKSYYYDVGWLPVGWERPVPLQTLQSLGVLQRRCRFRPTIGRCSFQNGAGEIRTREHERLWTYIYSRHRALGALGWEWGTLSTHSFWAGQTRSVRCRRCLRRVDTDVCSS